MPIPWRWKLAQMRWSHVIQIITAQLTSSQFAELMHYLIDLLDDTDKRLFFEYGINGITLDRTNYGILLTKIAEYKIYLDLLPFDLMNIIVNYLRTPTVARFCRTATKYKSSFTTYCYKPYAQIIGTDDIKNIISEKAMKAVYENAWRVYYGYLDEPYKLERFSTLWLCKLLFKQNYLTHFEVETKTIHFEHDTNELWRPKYLTPEDIIISCPKYGSNVLFMSQTFRYFKLKSLRIDINVNFLVKTLFQEISKMSHLEHLTLKFGETYSDDPQNTMYKTKMNSLKRSNKKWTYRQYKLYILDLVEIVLNIFDEKNSKSSIMEYVFGKLMSGNNMKYPLLRKTPFIMKTILSDKLINKIETLSLYLNDMNTLKIIQFINRKGFDDNGQELHLMRTRWTANSNIRVINESIRNQNSGHKSMKVFSKEIIERGGSVFVGNTVEPLWRIVVGDNNNNFVLPN